MSFPESRWAAYARGRRPAGGRRAPGVRGALLAGGNGPNSVTWLECGLQMVVLGPAARFDGERAIAAARALARVNAA